MLNITMVAPFEPNGRYKGGISSVVNTLCFFAHENASDINIDKFNTCVIKRNDAAKAKFNFDNLKNAYSIYKSLPQAVLGNNADVLYYHTSVGFALLKDLLILMHTKKKTGLPTVLHIHFADYEKIMTGIKPVDLLILKILIKYVDRIVFLSSKTKEQFVQHGIQESKCRVVYNFSALRYTEEQLFSEINEEDDTKQFVFVGSIDERKGLFDVLEVMTQTDGRYVLYVCGSCSDDQTKEKFEKYRVALGDKLVFHGFVDGDTKREIFRNSDVLILTSYGEGLPVVILEAFSAGCGVVVSDVGAIPEIVGSENGAVLKAGDLQQIKEALETYIQMDSERLERQQKLNYGLSNDYTIEKFTEAFVGICREVACSDKRI